ncbi:MAG TPA: hypothetical protein VGJ28_10030 [Micromonosporaceae bacterium]|jgi:hypothetical protein
MAQQYARGPALYVQARPSRLIPVLVSITVLIIVGVIGGVIGAALFSSRSSAAAGTTEARNLAAISDVKLTTCAVDRGNGWPRASAQVTNTGTTRASYLITIAFQSADGATQYSTASTSVQALAPGQRATAVAEGLTTAPRNFTCAVAGVNRE